MRLREDIEAKRSALILFALVVPVKGANAHLKSDKLLASVSELLVAFLDRVVVMRSVLNAQRVA